MVCCLVVVSAQEYQHLNIHPDISCAARQDNACFVPCGCLQAVAPVIGYKKRPLEEATQKLDQLAKQ